MKNLVGDVFFWLSVASILLMLPVSFLANVLTPKIVQKHWHNKLTSTKQKILKMESDIEKIERIVTNPTYAITVIGRELFFCLAFEIFTMGAFIVSFEYKRDGAYFMYAIASLITVMYSGFFIRSLEKFSSLRFKIMNFDSWKIKEQKEIDKQRNSIVSISEKKEGS